MKPQSAKNKGRTLQKHVCKKLGDAFEGYRGITGEDFMSRSMGANGTDVVISPLAKRVIGDIPIECKNVEKLNVPQVFFAHAAKYPSKTALLVHKKNQTIPLATLRFSDFMALLEKAVRYDHEEK